MKYSDIVSFIVFITCLPSIVVKAILMGLPIITLIGASKCRCDRFAVANLYLLLGLSYVFNITEKYWIALVSNLLYPIGFYNYIKNRKIIKFFRKHVHKGQVRYPELTTDIRNALEKGTVPEILMKMTNMVSLLPTIRHVFINNPFLFRYKLYLTNQETKPFKDTPTMCRILMSYITDPSYILKKKSKEELEAIGFNPDYYNNISDKDINYDNLGIQVCNLYTTCIYLETIHKTVPQLLDSIQTHQYNDSIMNSIYPLYKDLNQIEIVHNTSFSDLDRVKCVDLVVGYDDLYHVITGKVEVNIRESNIIEHPMLGLYHNGVIMVYTWNVINDLFANHVATFLNSIE